MSYKCLVIGLDGASPEVLEWAKLGKLPNLAKFIKEGVSGELLSTIPFHSGVAWPAFLTGKNPGNTGIFSWAKRLPDSYEIVSFNSYDLQNKVPIWKILDDYHKKSIIIGIPLTYPPIAINGIMISGFPAPGIFAYPDHLIKKLQEFDFDIRVEHEERMEQFFELSRKQKQVVLYLMKNYAWDFLIVNFQAHQHWIKHGMVLQQCKDLDNIIGELLQAIDKNTIVMIMSDHGTMPVYKDVCINTFLKKIGLLQLHTKSYRRKVLKPLTYFWHDYSWIKQRLHIKHGLSDIVWEKTKAFSIDGDGIYINLKGREPKGIVNSDEYEMVRNYIIDKLYDLKDAETGKNVITRVFKKEEVYHGKYTYWAPDILIESAYGYRLQLWNTRNKVIDYTRRRTFQSIMGIFAIKGSGIKSGKEIKGAKIIDLMPTILHILNVPIPADIDGKVLMEIFEKGTEFDRNVIYEEKIKYHDRDYKTLDKEINSRIWERLKKLGYSDENT